MTKDEKSTNVANEIDDVSTTNTEISTDKTSSTTQEKDTKVADTKARSSDEVVVADEASEKTENTANDTVDSTETQITDNKTETVETTTKKLSKKAKIIIVIIAVVVAAGAIGGVLVYNTYQQNKKIDDAAIAVFNPYQDRYTQISSTTEEEYNHDKTIESIKNLISLKEELNNNKDSMKMHDGNIYSGTDELITKIDETINTLKNKVVEDYQKTVDAINIDVNTATKEELNNAKTQLENLKNQINTDKETLPNIFGDETNTIDSSATEKTTSYDNKIAEIDKAEAEKAAAEAAARRNARSSSSSRSSNSGGSSSSGSNSGGRPSGHVGEWFEFGPAEENEFYWEDEKITGEEYAERVRRNEGYY